MGPKQDYPGNEKMDHLLRFLHRHVPNMYCAREIKTSLWENPSSVLIDLLTTNDIAYSILVYKSCRKYLDDVFRKKSDPTFIGSSQPKFHVKRG